jgi:hypothetical protein
MKSAGRVARSQPGGQTTPSLRDGRILARLTAELRHPGRDPHGLVDHRQAEQIRITCDSARFRSTRADKQTGSAARSAGARTLTQDGKTPQLLRGANRRGPNRRIG